MVSKIAIASDMSTNNMQNTQMISDIVLSIKILDAFNLVF